jgi:hypothetical protein
LLGQRLIQLTWQNGIAHVYDRPSFREISEFAYEGEGWGLCFDGQRLVMSDGSSSLFFRDPDDFELLGEVQIRLDGEPTDQLNELECVGALVYANVWQTDRIVRIDPASGEVLTQIDCSDLLSEEQAHAADVLNGIAYDAETGHFFITGKLWPLLFEVRFDFDPGAAAPEPTPAPGATPGPSPSVVAPSQDASTPSAEDGEDPSTDRPGSGGTSRHDGCDVRPRGQADTSWWVALAVALGVRRRLGIAFRTGERHSPAR